MLAIPEIARLLASQYGDAAAIEWTCSNHGEPYWDAMVADAVTYVCFLHS